MQGKGAGSALTAPESQDILLAGAGTTVLSAAAETLFQVTGVCQCPPQVAVAGNTVRKPSVTQGALIAVPPPKPFFAMALARENITLGTRGASNAAVASLASLLWVQVPVPLFTLLTLQTLGMRRAEALPRIGVTVILSMCAVAGCTATILVPIEAV